MSLIPKKTSRHHLCERLGSIEEEIARRVEIMRDRLSRRVDIWNGETPLNPYVIKELDQGERHGAAVREFKQNRK